MPFLIHATETLLNSSGLLQTIYFTVPFCTSHGLGQELQRILNDPKCQAPNNIGVMLPPDQGSNGLKTVLEMICQWAELFRVPFVIINLTGALETRKVVMELSIARFGSAFARVVLVDNNGYDLTASAVATTILSLCKKSAYHSSAGGGVQRPSRRGGVQGAARRPDRAPGADNSWNSDFFGRGGWRGARGSRGRGFSRPTEQYGRPRAYTGPYGQFF